MEASLDTSKINSWLADPPVSSMIKEAIETRQRRGEWNMLEYVIMPNHLHLFFELECKGLKSTMERFRRWTGKQIAKSISAPPKRIWQRDWFDHWSRSDQEDERIALYIRRNPMSAGLVDDYLDWPLGGRLLANDLTRTSNVAGTELL